jgi:peptidoglycan/LPS O-acetylase OafA/YrhL
MKISYYKELDGVRAIAALMVMVFHFFLYLKTTAPTLLVIKKFTGIGQTGVSLFFVLSGFLITRILLKTKIMNTTLKVFTSEGLLGFSRFIICFWRYIFF